MSRQKAQAEHTIDKVRQRRLVVGKTCERPIGCLPGRAKRRAICFLSLSVVCALKPAGLRNLRDALVKCVRSHPKVWPDVVRVHFTGLTDAAITIEVTAWFQVTEQDQFLEARQDLLLQILDVIEAFGATPAFAKALAQPASR